MYSPWLSAFQPGAGRQSPQGLYTALLGLCGLPFSLYKVSSLRKWEEQLHWWAWIPKGYVLPGCSYQKLQKSHCPFTTHHTNPHLPHSHVFKGTQEATHEPPDAPPKYAGSSSCESDLGKNTGYCARQNNWLSPLVPQNPNTVDSDTSTKIT